MQSVKQILQDMYEGHGEFVENCVIQVDGEEVLLHPVIAKLRNQVMEQRELDRQHYCDHHDIDITRFTGCHGCEQTGIHRGTKLPCWCHYGLLRQRQADQAEADRTTWLSNNWERLQREDRNKAMGHDNQ